MDRDTQQGANRRRRVKKKAVSGIKMKVGDISNADVPNYLDIGDF